MEPGERSVGIDVASLLDGIGVTSSSLQEPVSTGEPVMAPGNATALGDFEPSRDLQNADLAQIEDKFDGIGAAQVLAWEIIGAPLFQTVLAAGIDPASARQSFEQILDRGLDLARELAAHAGADQAAEGDQIRWRAAVAAVGVVSDYFRDHEGALPGDEFFKLVQDLAESTGRAVEGGGIEPVSGLQRIDVADAMHKVADAVSRYSFEKPAADLGRDVFVKLQNMAAALESGGGEKGHSLLCLLARAYANSHHQEVDLLLDLDGPGREAYLAQHKGDVLGPIWSRVDRYGDALGGIASVISLYGGKG